MGLIVKVTHDGLKNASIQITGSRPLDWVDAIRLDGLTPPPRHVKIDAVYYAVSDGSEVELSWGSVGAPVPFLPLAGRGKIDFAEVGGCHDICDGQGHGIQIRTRKSTEDVLFTVILDLSKHIGERNG